MKAQTPVLKTRPHAGEAFKLLWFIDKRPTSTAQIRLIRQQLKALPENANIHLDIVDVINQPYLAEHFKLVATPALVKDRIIAMMAHDLRNPLTAASIALETLELAYEPDSPKAEKFTPKLIVPLLKTTKVQIRTINSTIAEILQAAKGSCAQLRVSPQVLDVRSLCYTVIESFQNKLEHKKQTITTDIP